MIWYNTTWFDMRYEKIFDLWSVRYCIVFLYVRYNLWMILSYITHIWCLYIIHLLHLVALFDVKISEVLDITRCGWSFRGEPRKVGQNLWTHRLLGPSLKTAKVLKMDGWKTILSFWDGFLAGAIFILGGVTYFEFRILIRNWDGFCPWNGSAQNRRNHFFRNAVWWPLLWSTEHGKTIGSLTHNDASFEQKRRKQIVTGPQMCF